MAVCNHCGTDNADGVKFCSECGAPMSAAPEIAPAAAAAVPEIPEIPVPAPEIPAAAPEAAAEAPVFDAPQPVYTQPEPVAVSLEPASPTYTYTPPQTSYTTAQSPHPYPAGGLIAWAIITMLFCWPIGLVALINAVRINKSATEAEQLERISRTKKWCIAATVCGVLSLLSTLGNAHRMSIIQ